MVFKINTEKMKQKLENFEKGSDRAPSPFVKFTEPGDYNVRAVPYPYSHDPSAEPFKEVSCHYLKGVGYFYCPKDNKNDKCHICEFVWSQVNECETKEEKQPWYKMLPTYYVLLPVLIRGKEEEGVKFLKIASSKSKMSKKHTKLMKWCMNDKTACFLDPEAGHDIVLSYIEVEKSMRAHLNNATVMFDDLSLDFEKTKFGKKGEYEAFVETIPNVDEDIFPVKTTVDSLEAVRQLSAKMAPPESKKSEEELNNNNGTTVAAESKPKATTTEDLESQLEEMGL